MWEAEGPSLYTIGPAPRSGEALVRKGPVVSVLCFSAILGRIQLFLWLSRSDGGMDRRWSAAGEKNHCPRRCLQPGLCERYRWGLRGKRRAWEAKVLETSHCSFSLETVYLLKRSVCPSPPGGRKSWFSLDDQSIGRRRRERNPEGRECRGLPNPFQTSELFLLSIFPYICGNCVYLAVGHQIMFINITVSEVNRTFMGAGILLCCVPKHMCTFSHTEVPGLGWSIYHVLRCSILWIHLTLNDFRDTGPEYLSACDYIHVYWKMGHFVNFSSLGIFNLSRWLAFVVGMNHVFTYL